MMLITLQGPQACGKTLTHEILKKYIQRVEEKTGHSITIREVMDNSLPTAALDTLVPCFRVMRFKASGKWVDTFNVSVPHGKRMQDVSNLLRLAKNMPKGGSMVVVDALTETADRFFYPIEVKDES